MTEEFIYVRILHTGGIKVYAEGVELVNGEIIKARLSKFAWGQGFGIIVNSRNRLSLDQTWRSRTGSIDWFERVSPLELLAMQAQKE